MYKPEREFESLAEEVKHIESESRMILPGFQALFGFQLIAVFNQRFAEELSYSQQILHWAALGCTALATIFIITPAAFHRLAEPHKVSRKFSFLGNWCVTASLFPMVLGCVIDFYLIGMMITHDSMLSLIVSSILFVIFILFWYVGPLFFRNKKCA